VVRYIAIQPSTLYYNVHLDSRDELWCFIIETEDIMFSVFLHSMNDYDLFHVLLGGHFKYIIPDDVLETFRIKCITSIHKMSKLYYSQ